MIPAGTKVKRKDSTRDPNQSHRVPPGACGVVINETKMASTKDPNRTAFGRELVLVRFDEPHGNRCIRNWYCLPETLIPLE